MIDIKQLLTTDAVAKLKGVSHSRISYHLKQADAPTPIFIGDDTRPYFQKSDIANWQPKFRVAKRKPKSWVGL